MKIFIILCCLIQSIQCYNDSIEYKQRNSAGATYGEIMIQRITLPVADVHQLFWWEREEKVVYTDPITGMIHSWSYDGDINEHYVGEVSGESLVFTMPVKNEKKKKILASDLNIRILTVEDSDITVSDPVIVIKEEGYHINKGHSAEDGTLYILLMHNLRIGKPSKLYRVREEKAELAYTFSSVVTDFVFSDDYKKMYVISKAGKSVCVFDFDMDAGEISNEKEVYQLINDHLGYQVMSGIEIDNENNLWITTKQSYVLRINDQYELNRVIETPHRGLTSITFGGYKNKNLLVGTTKLCAQGEMQAGSVLILTGLTTSGKADELVKWSA